ncbi:MAG: ribonuclease J, partial [Caulobacterales bacterium]|uniref:ribonuclease J n=1 Tax=Glycocaulis sp. TaxID=1969725 RepID=UPI003FA0C55C
VTFGDLSTPGVDVILPDPRFIEERRHQLLGIVLTHAHEDHMGAVAYLWERLRCPIYATPFTAWLMRDRLAERGLLGEAKVREISLTGRFEIGPFDLELITLTHSIPEPNGLAIRTPAGLILHTGDWKIDPEPLIGAPTDPEAIKALGKEGILAMVCDSTNVFTPGEAGSEGSVRENLTKVIAEQKGKVAIAAFASNVARLETAILAAEANGRRVCLLGRSMHRMSAAAKAVGLLQSCAPFVEEDEAGYFPSDKIAFVCTGSQGEPRAALSRIADGNHPNISLGNGDTVIFSSRIIPGNERGIFEMMNKLALRGVKIITERERHVHVSGHPCRDELRQMYEWARPKVAIPVHGEARHLIEHAAYAKSLGVPASLVPKNGSLIAINADGARIIDEAPSGRLHLDGNFIVEADNVSMRERRKLAYGGAIAVALAVSPKGDIVSGPDIRALGVPDGEDNDMDEFLDALADAAERAFGQLRQKARRDEDEVEEAVRQAVRREANRLWGKKPVVEAMVLMT